MSDIEQQLDESVVHQREVVADQKEKISPADYEYTGRYVVLFKDEATRDDLNALKLIDGFSFPDDKKSYDDSFDKLKVIIGEFDKESRKILEKFTEPVEKSTKLVEFVHEEYILPAPKAMQGGGSDTEGDLNQPGVQQQTLSRPGVPFGIARLTIPEPYRFHGPANGGEGVDIYVIDAGVRIDHSEFGGGRARWTTFETDNSPVLLPFFGPPPRDIIQDDRIGEGNNGHGTHVAGIAAGNTCGVAKAATIIAIKPYVRWSGMEVPDGSNAPTGLIIKAIVWVRLQARHSGRPSIINYSMDGLHPEGQWRAVMRKATSNHVHFVYAAGNDNSNLPARPNHPVFPDDAIYVGASDWEDKRWRATWGGSNHGPGIDVFAPGAFITSASHVDVNQFKLMSGTSMAAPHVAGLIACLISAEPNHPRNRNPKLMKARVLDLAQQEAMDFTGDAGPIGPHAANPFTTRRLVHFPAALIT